MDLNESPELTRFRSEVRDWTKANYPYDADDPYRYQGSEQQGPDDIWYQRLAGKQWLAYRWPREWGGSGFTPQEQIVFVDELVRCGATVPRGFGISMIGPLLLQFGSEAQKNRFARPIARNEEQWCQGYSEPNSGSDLASLQTRAELQGDEFIVNGQKTWTSRASLANYIFCLVRTDPEVKKQEGISFLLIDMKSPGLSIKPIRQLNGLSGFFETFFDDVKVPAENLVGEINKGWTMAKALLGHERVNTGTAIDLKQLSRTIKSIAREYHYNGQPILRDPDFRGRMAQLDMDSDCLAYTRYRLLTSLMQGRAPGPESSIFKLNQTIVAQNMYALAMEAMGPDAAAWYDTRLSPEAFSIPMTMAITRAWSILSGSNEIQRNIISKRVLGLPD